VELPDVPQPLLSALKRAAGTRRCALVGGAVRDLLLHRHHEDPWRGLPDLDLVVEGRAVELLQPFSAALQAELGEVPELRVQEHGQFATLELEVDLPPELGGTWLLDVASARAETYPHPAQNPQVRLGSLIDDLSRRDFSVNAIALLLSDGQLLDPHDGQRDLAARQLSFLHEASLRDDPTRLLRAARYCARLGFSLSPAAMQQVQTTLEAWPWSWCPGDDPGQAPPALGTRLRMELELLLKRQPWPEALSALQSWGGLALLDPGLQADRHWRRRLRWAERLGLPLMPALMAGAKHPLNLAERLQVPHRQHRLLVQLASLQQRLTAVTEQPQRPSWWCELLEAPGLSADAVALAVALAVPHWRCLLRWWLRWRHVRSPASAAELMQLENIKPGPELGRRLHQLRMQTLDQFR